METMKILVVAGGQGTKLWPYSRQDRPKQFLPIYKGKSTFQYGIETFLKRYSPEDIYVSTKRKFIKYVSEQAPQIPLKNYIVEPDVVKDRGPGEGLAFLTLSMQHPDEPFFYYQSDMIREPEEAFLDMVHDAGVLAKKHKRFMTGGIKATAPNMGADYLQLGKQIPMDGKQEVFEVDKFHFRKETMHETRALVENYHVVAHWNHTCWYPDLMLDAYAKYRPDWHEGLMKMRDVMGKPGEDEAIRAIYADMKKGPTEDVTRNIMDSGEAVAFLLPFKVTDFGTWGSVYDFFVDGDGTGNYEAGKVVSVDSTGSLIKTVNPNKLVAIAGLDNIVVVDTEDALLVIPKDKIDKIKKVQEYLSERKLGDYL
jgi:mannose-1-phosphate guanylyltransferase